jgi:tetraacyldisaccharide 4'-kinase
MGIKQTLLNGWLKPNLLTGLLRPFSTVYKGVFALRRTAFSRGILARYRAPVAVIIVGNLTVGGTGKTPLVMYLVDQLRKQGFSPGVISRGYGGASKNYPLLVYANTPVAESGDEPALIVRRTGVAMAVGPDRRASIELLLKHHELDVIISDDGLQHFALHRDVEICLIDDTSEQKNENLLPAGPYREPLSRLMSVDFIVRHGGSLGNADNQFTMALKPGKPIPVSAGNHARFNAKSQIQAVAGIGRPQRFFDTCTELGYCIIANSFADHHHFSASDIDFGESTVLMTEKDAVKCVDIAGINHWYLPVEAVISDGFIAAIVAKISEKIKIGF